MPASSSGRTLTLLATLLALLALPACGGDAGGPLPPLYRVQGQAGATYLFGTLHLGVEADELPQRVLDALDSSVEVYLESTIPASERQAFRDASRLPVAAKTLEQLLGVDGWPKLRALLPSVSPDELAALRPWAAGSLIFQRRFATSKPIDAALEQRAAGGGKVVDYLEHWSAQVDPLNAVTPEEDAKSLGELIDSLDTVVARYRELREAYLRGDDASLFALAPDAGAMPAVGSAMYDSFIVARTTRWLDVVAKACEDGGAFIAVGFAHVLGDRGLVALLEARNVTLDRVR